MNFQFTLSSAIEIDNNLESISVVSRENIPGKGDDIFLKRLIQCVNANISNEHLDAEQLMDMLFVSRSVLFKKVKRVTGMSVSLFVRDVRLKRAALLLEENQLSISQVAYAVGFSDPAYFTKCFKEKHCVTPTEFRNNHRGLKG